MQSDTFSTEGERREARNSFLRAGSKAFSGVSFVVASTVTMGTLHPRRRITKATPTATTPTPTPTSSGASAKPTTTTSTASTTSTSTTTTTTSPVGAAYLLVGAWAAATWRASVRRVRRRRLSRGIPRRQKASRTTPTTTPPTTNQTPLTPQGKNYLSLLKMPPELLFLICAYLPTNSLAAMLLMPSDISVVAATVLSTRPHFISNLDDLRAFTHDVESHPIPLAYSPVLWSHHLKRQQIGPTFYRSGTMILFARHFTRLIPEARILLGVGYAMVLAWFMCLFYVLPFIGALALFWVMDIVDVIGRQLFLFLHSLPLSVLSWILPKYHSLHPSQPAKPPRVQAGCIRRIKFSACAPVIPGQTEPFSCCGLAGNGWDLDAQEITDLDTTITGQRASSNLTLRRPSVSSTTTTTTNPSKPFWGLMSPYTPWHLYLLTHTLSLHPEISHLTLSRVSLAWWFRLHLVPNLRILILHACEMDETGIGLVAQAFPNLLGLVLRGSEVRCGGWDVESIRRGSAGRLAEPPTTVFPAGVDPAESILASPNHGSNNNKGWWSSRKPTGVDKSVFLFSSLRVARFEMCTASCAIDSVRMILDRCPSVERVEFVGCGLEEETFLQQERLGIVEWEKMVPERTRADVSGLWWEGQNSLEGIEACIEATNQRFSKGNEVDEDRDDDGDNENFEDDDDEEKEKKEFEKEFLPVTPPPGFKKVLVVQGSALPGLRDKWYLHLKTRSQGVWGPQQ